MKLLPRRSEERGKADHGWLKSFHTFSYDTYGFTIYSTTPIIHLQPRYKDYTHEHYGPLRVINEDRIEPLTGFGMHSRREYEIFCYVVSGELEQ